MSRDRLPNRRPHLVEPILLMEKFECLVGFGIEKESGRVRELFLDGLKIGTPLAAIMNDSCILISMLLQHGYTVSELRDRMTLLSPYHRLLRRAAEIENNEVVNGTPAASAPH